MAYKKRSYRIRKTFRRRSGMSRRPKTKNLVNRQISAGVHYFKRVVKLSPMVFNSLSPITGVNFFSLNQLPNVSEFTDLFDEYRILGISLRFIPHCSSSDANPIATHITVPNITTVVDYDDSSVPADLNTLLQYPNAKTTNCIRQHSRYFKPKISVEVYKTAITTGYSSQRLWLDCTDTSIPHFGVKWALDGSFNINAPDYFQITPYATFYLAFKGVR